MSGILLMCWVTGALLHMYGLSGGFLTNYLADVCFPPWFYLLITRQSHKSSVRSDSIFSKTRIWLGSKPEIAALSIFIVGVITEVKTLFWPGGIISGTYDPWDIVAYATGLLICYITDKISQNRTDRS